MPRPTYAQLGPIHCRPRDIAYVLEQKNGNVNVCFATKNGLYTEYINDDIQAEAFLEDYRQYQKEFKPTWTNDTESDDREGAE